MHIISKAPDEIYLIRPPHIDSKSHFFGHFMVKGSKQKISSKNVFLVNNFDFFL